MRAAVADIAEDEWTPPEPRRALRRYLRRLAGLSCGLLLLVGAANCAGVHGGFADFGFVSLYRYQLAKLDRHEPADIVFVGDSSLGNGVDAALFSRLSGRPTLNLALTGAYGYAGSYNMIRRALDAAHPKIVVVMQSTDMMSRPPADLGHLFTARFSDFAFLDVSPGELGRAYFTFETLEQTVAGAAQSWFGAKDDDPVDPQADYMPQGEPLDDAKFGSRVAAKSVMTAASLAKGQPRFLAKIVALCRAEGLTCLYMHGPLIDLLCDRMGAYLTAADAAITGTGMTLVPGTPRCLARAEVGDSEDHANPAVKAAVTRFYYDRLAPYLAPQGDPG